MTAGLDLSKTYILDYENGHFREATENEQVNSNLDIVIKNYGNGKKIQVLEKRQITIENKATALGFVKDLLGIGDTSVTIDTATAFYNRL